MTLTPILLPPKLEEFTALSEHQEQTPTTFFGGKPVLHYHVEGAKAWIAKDQVDKLPLFPADCRSAPTAPLTGLSDDPENTFEQTVDLFVNSETLTLYSSLCEKGVQIPYQPIGIYGVKKFGPEGKTQSAVYLQLNLSDGGPSDDEFETVELVLIPPPSTISSEEEITGVAQSPQSEAMRLFRAIADCSVLHPDPVEEDEDGEPTFGGIKWQGVSDEDYENEGDASEDLELYTVTNEYGEFKGPSGLPPPMPGSSGWITAENVDEYFDADGNWIQGEGEEEAVEELGDGAGTVRGREEDHGVEAAESGGNKRARVE